MSEAPIKNGRKNRRHNAQIEREAEELRHDLREAKSLLQEYRERLSMAKERVKRAYECAMSCSIEHGAELPRLEDDVQKLKEIVGTLKGVISTTDKLLFGLSIDAISGADENRERINKLH